MSFERRTDPFSPCVDHSCLAGNRNQRIHRKQCRLDEFGTHEECREKPRVTRFRTVLHPQIAARTNALERWAIDRPFWDTTTTSGLLEDVGSSSSQLFEETVFQYIDWNVTDPVNQVSYSPQEQLVSSARFNDRGERVASLSTIRWMIEI